MLNTERQLDSQQGFAKSKLFPNKFLASSDRVTASVDREELWMLSTWTSVRPLIQPLPALEMLSCQ